MLIGTLLLVLVGTSDDHVSSYWGWMWYGTWWII